MALVTAKTKTGGSASLNGQNTSSAQGNHYKHFVDKRALLARNEAMGGAGATALET